MLPRFAVGSHRRVIARAQGSAVRDVGERVSGSVGLGSAAGLTAGEQAGSITRCDGERGTKGLRPRRHKLLKERGSLARATLAKDSNY